MTAATAKPARKRTADEQPPPDRPPDLAAPAPSGPDAQAEPPEAAPRVYAAIARVQAALAREGIAKAKPTGGGVSYAFRGIDAVYNALAPVLAREGLCVLPRVVAREQVERASKSGGTLFYTTLTVEFDFVSAEDGSRHVVRTVGEAMDSGDKSSNKAMSAAYKYACFMAFCIPTEGDNDADAHQPEPAPRQQARPANGAAHNAPEPADPTGALMALDAELAAAGAAKAGWLLGEVKAAVKAAGQGWDAAGWAVAREAAAACEKHAWLDRLERLLDAKGEAVERALAAAKKAAPGASLTQLPAATLRDLCGRLAKLPDAKGGAA